MKGLLFAFVIVLIISEIALPSLALTDFPQPPDVGKTYSLLQVPSSLNYIVKQINATEVKYVKATNSTNATTLTKKLIHINATYSVNINLIKYNSFGNLTVSVKGNFTKDNISFYEGNFTLNPTIDPFTMEYPFITPQYLFNSTYEIQTSSYQVVFDLIKTLNLNFAGNSEKALKYIVYDSITGNNYTVTVLPNGLIYEISNSSFNMTLQSLPSIINITLENSIKALNESVINSSYEYTLYQFSPTASTILPQSQLELYYPITFSNGIVTFNEFELRILPNETVTAPRTLGGFTIYNYIDISEINQTFVSFVYNPGQDNVVFNGENFTLVNMTKVSTPIGQFNAYLYKNVSDGGIEIQYLYVAKSGLLLEYKGVEVRSGVPTTVDELKYIGDNYVSPTQTFPFHSISDTQLPYNVVNPNTSLIIAVVVTLVIVAIIILLHRRFG